MLSEGNAVYSEVDGIALLLHYNRMSAGMCSVIEHPQWGTAIYPATIFTTAPVESVRAVLASFVGEGDIDARSSGEGREYAQVAGGSAVQS